MYAATPLKIFISKLNARAIALTLIALILSACAEKDPSQNASTLPPASVPAAISLKQDSAANNLSSSKASIAIISDIDDTLKITHVNCFPDAFIRGPFTATAFLGMSELYNGLLTGNVTPAVYYVSGSPSLLTNAVEWFLGRNDFPVGEIYLRDFLGRPDIITHKESTIREIMGQNKKDQFLMFGDDTESDFTIYHDMRAEFPERMIAAYIHLVNNDKQLPADVTGYFTSADLALRETLAGRLSEAKTKEIFEKFLTTDIDEEEILPEFEFCPQAGWLTSIANGEKVASSLQRLAPQVEAKLKAKCDWNKEQMERRQREQNMGRG